MARFTGKKETVWCDAYINGELTRSSRENRTVYHRQDGSRFVVTYWKGREEHALDVNNHWRLEARRINMKKLF